MSVHMVLARNKIRLIVSMVFPRFWCFTESALVNSLHCQPGAVFNHAFASGALSFPS